MNETKICLSAFSKKDGAKIGWHYYYHWDMKYENSREVGKLCESGTAIFSKTNEAYCDSLNTGDASKMQCAPFYLQGYVTRKVSYCSYYSPVIYSTGW